MKSDPYLYQTYQWQQFWLKTHNQKHQCFEINAYQNGITLKGNVFMYQWRFGQKLMHIPAGPYIDESPDTIKKEDLTSILMDYLTKILEIATQHNVVALRLNLDPKLASILKITTSNELQAFLVKSRGTRNIGLPVTTSGRLMFPAVAAIDISKITTQASVDVTPTLKDLELFISDNKEFWLDRSETTRKQSRKSTRSGFVLDTEISDENLEAIYQLMKETSQRQNFVLPPYQYFMTLSEESFCNILAIKDEDGKTHCGWIGLHHNSTLTNQYAGNDSLAYKNHLPNLSHVYGLFLAKQLGCSRYDLGGYEVGSQFNRFKDGYNPDIVMFPGGVDIVYLPWYYRIIELGGKSKKVLRGKK
jgi:hypothetical protein